MMNIDASTFLTSLAALSDLLEEADAEPQHLVLVGGSALLAQGLISRTTRDVDILAIVDPEDGLLDPRPLSESLKLAAAQVAVELKLDPDWLNTGPADQVSAGLPEGFSSRLTKKEFGPVLTIYLPARFDLIHLKLFAVVDQGPGRHSHDLKTLAPTEEEMLAASRWVLTQDASEVFPGLVHNTLKALGYGDLVARL
ncbi:DUF6036 family nucleotidyltransferase [Verrucomicrobium sp. BvORR034]|uniref:DUF6036 family nucleotidyltransferase n=1 Tax=Verrucomicrobium sp. BvORR034 TaxID=1396418 RepID=UPI0006794F9E|nr:DUF6036 family nucleotidyltransferase [Verrucomicrobium sp. BvORR034]